MLYMYLLSIPPLLATGTCLSTLPPSPLPTLVYSTYMQGVLNDEGPPGFLAVIWFGSSPTSPLPSVSSSDDTQEDRERETSCWQERGKEAAEKPNQRPHENLVLYKSFNTLCVSLFTPLPPSAHLYPISPSHNPPTNFVLEFDQYPATFLLKGFKINDLVFVTCSPVMYFSMKIRTFCI